MSRWWDESDREHSTQNELEEEPEIPNDHTDDDDRSHGASFTKDSQW